MYKLYSARIREQNGVMDVFTYDPFPSPFRTQVFYIIKDTVHQISNDRDDTVFDALHDQFCREIGAKSLRTGNGFSMYATKEDYIESYIDRASDEHFLDFLDFAFYFLSDVSVYRSLQVNNDQSLINFISGLGITQLNDRFKQHALGYEYINNTLIRKDSEVIHSEYIKPAINLIHNDEFRGANEEYMHAWEAFRHGNHEDAIINAAKAFESVMKIICTGRNFQYDEHKDTASKLLNILKNNSFFPSYLHVHLDSVVKSLGNGVPTIRNKDSGHGQGVEIRELSDSYVDYVLGLVAVNIVFLVNLYNENK